MFPLFDQVVVFYFASKNDSLVSKRRVGTIYYPLTVKKLL